MKKRTVLVVFGIILAALLVGMFVFHSTVIDSETRSQATPTTVSDQAENSQRRVTTTASPDTQTTKVADQGKNSQGGVTTTSGSGTQTVTVNDQGSESSGITVTRHYENPKPNDEMVRVTVTYSISESVAKVPTEWLSGNATVLSKDGFDLRPTDSVPPKLSKSPEGARIAVWDNTTQEPTITFSRPVKPEYIGEGWAHINTMNRGPYYYASYNVNLVVTGDPVTIQAKEQVVFGELTVYERRVSEDHVIKLIVPNATDLPESPSSALDALAYTGRRLGGGPGVSRIFAQPGLSGAYADKIMTYNASRPVTEIGSFAIHEYAHVIQPSFPRENNWLNEAYAGYYDSYIPLRLTGNYDAFREDVRPPTSLSRHIVVANGTGALKAEAVLAALDMRIRNATNGQKGLSQVFQNKTDVTMSLADVKRRAEQVAGREFDTFFQRYVYGDAYPTLPETPPPGYVPATESDSNTDNATAT